MPERGIHDDVSALQCDRACNDDISGGSLEPGAHPSDCDVLRAVLATMSVYVECGSVDSAVVVAPVAVLLTARSIGMARHFVIPGPGVLRALRQTIRNLMICRVILMTHPLREVGTPMPASR